MDKNLKNLVENLVKIKNPDNMVDFLKIILTPKELENIPKRLEILHLLKQGMNQRKIANKLGTGIATVTRGSKELKYNNLKNVA